MTDNHNINNNSNSHNAYPMVDCTVTMAGTVGPALPPYSLGPLTISLPSSSLTHTGTTTGTTTTTTTTTTTLYLPAEVVHHCLVSFADWGDLAKLACVGRRDWRNLVQDASRHHPSAAWQLAQAWLLPLNDDRDCDNDVDNDDDDDVTNSDSQQQKHQNHGSVDNINNNAEDDEQDSEDGNNDIDGEQAIQNQCTKPNHHGLLPNPARAVELLEQLSGLDANELPCVGDSKADENAVGAVDGVADVMVPTSSLTNAYFAPAMKELAWCYLKAKVPVPEIQDKAKERQPQQQQQGNNNNESNALSKSTKLGLQWLEAAYSKGTDADAAYHTAMLYEYGRYGVPVDVIQAAVWFAKAAHSGHVEAMTELALCYELGCGVPQSDTMALDWYIRAAQHGHITAQYAVGEAFELAKGVPQSDVEAVMWYAKAAWQGQDRDSLQALRRLQDIARIILPSQMAVLFDVPRAGNAQ